MKLNGKCKVEFEKWLKSNHNLDSIYDKEIEHNIVTTYYVFYELPKSAQYGVLVDFFDSVGIFIDSINVNQNKEAFVCGVNGVQLGYWKSRPEARTKAIEKAIKEFNKQ